jgi:zinc transporter
MDAKPDLAEVDGRPWSIRFPAKNGRPSWEWVHYDLVNVHARAEIESNPELPDFAKHVLSGVDDTPHFRTDGACVAGVMPTYARTGDIAEHKLTYWHFAMAPTWLITGRRLPTRSLVEIWERVQAGFEPASAASLIDLAVATFAREVRERLDALGQDVEAVEDTLTDKDELPNPGELARSLGKIRREATKLKRALIPLARTIHQETDSLPDWVDFPAGSIGDRALHSALDDIAALYDRTRALQDEIVSRQAETTNNRLYILTVMTMIFIPATFVTGFFGMNTGGLLWSGDSMPHGTLFAALICAGAAAGMLLVLRVMKWL